MTRILFFGRFRELGAGLESAPADIETVQGLIDWIARAAPEIGAALESGRARIAIDGEIVGDVSASLGDAREIAFLPPMSGG